MTPFDFEDYREFLRAWAESQPHQGRGTQAALARAADCQPAYLSQIFSGKAQLSLEQAEKIAVFLKLSQAETDFFLLLVQRERAGTTGLRNHFNRLISETQEQRAQLKNRVDAKVELGPKEQGIYFGVWMYSAIHLLATLPGFGTRDKIAAKLRLPSEVVEEILRFLISVGLLRALPKGGFESGNTRMHLPHDSPWILQHHSNWRLRAIQDVMLRRPESLHYSSIVSISRSDYKLIRESLLRAIESAKETVRDSKEEILVGFCLDFFEV